MSKGRSHVWGQAGVIDLADAIVISPPDLSGPEKQAITMLVEEVESRTCIHWRSETEWPSVVVPVIAVGQASALSALLADGGLELEGDCPDAAEGYCVRVRDDKDPPTILVGGSDARGVLFGVGCLLRNLRMNRDSVMLPADLEISSAPHHALRGHQLGYRDKTNSYCAWDLPQWEQYIRDLVVFGANAIELIPPRSDDNSDSIHFPRPPMEMMVGMSQLADNYGIDVWVWYPAMDADYADPATVEFALREWGEVFRSLPRLDAVFVPGGDPGKARPTVLMAMLEKQAASLLATHPQAGMWISPQGFSQEWMAEFLGILVEESLGWLTGVVHGPWVHVSMAEFRELIPSRYPIRNYPDITHSLSCQHPVPEWDPAYALTEGRESINPRPLDQAAIFRHAQPPTIGFLTYSEGCNDDVNKCIWSALGWDPERPIVDILREYSRYYIGERYEEPFAQGLLALERNWRGPLAGNASVQITLQQFQDMEASATPQELRNWRFQQALYRAYYDGYTRSRLIYERALEEEAMALLRQAPAMGSLAAVAEAERILQLAVTRPISQDWRTRICQLAEALFQSIHMQLSVKLYGAQEEVRGGNLDGIDFPLNDRPWLCERFAETRRLEEEGARLESIEAIVSWTHPGPGGFYDDLSDSGQSRHLVPGPGFDRDPAFLRSPLRKYPYRKDPRVLRRSWRAQTGSLGDAPFEMRYPELDPAGRYKVRVVYSESPGIKVRLEANDGIVVHPLLGKPHPRRPVEFDIPREATQGGQLTLRWYRESGRGGNGAGCEISEVWLIRQS